MSKGKVKVTQEAIDKLYEPEAFYQHGDNPAFKNYLEMMSENQREGKYQDYRTFSTNKYIRFQMARNVEDFLKRDLRINTAPRAALSLQCSIVGFMGYTACLIRLYPIGMHGIRKLSQTQMFHNFGYPGVLAAAICTASVYYVCYQTAKFSINRIYRNCLLGERDWNYERARNNFSHGEYYFSDVYTSAEEHMPDIARGEKAKKPIYIGSFYRNTA